MADVITLEIYDNGKDSDGVPSFGYDIETFRNHVTLAADTHETINFSSASPNAGQTYFLIFSATDDFYLAPGSSSFTLPGDTTDGTAPMLNPSVVKVSADGNWGANIDISLRATNACDVNVSLFS